MNTKEDNHYIPQFIIKKFTNKNNKIYEFLIEKKTWRLENGSKTDGFLTPTAVGKEKRIYVIETDGKKNDSLENYFSTIENQTKPYLIGFYLVK